MSGEFDVYFAGECVPGFEPEVVLAGIARTFKLDNEAASRLMDGSRHRIKSGCDKTTALRYREVMAAIGAIVTITRHGVAPDDSEADSSPETQHRELKPLVKGPASFTSQPINHHESGIPSPPDPEDGIAWEPPLTNRPTSNTSTTPVELSVAPVGSLLGNEQGTEPYKLVSVPDYEVSAAGEMIPNLPDEREIVVPKTDHLHIEPLPSDEPASSPH